MCSLFIEKWEKGFLTVYGIRKKRQDFLLMTWARQLYYRFLNNISDIDLPHDAGDFMLIDRKIIDLLIQTQERCLYLRGSIFSFGFPKIGIPYQRSKRFAGSTKFSLFKLGNLALDGIVNSSAAPLQYLFYFGFFTLTAMFLIIGIHFIGKISGLIFFPLGIASTLIFIMFSIAFNAFFWVF